MKVANLKKLLEGMPEDAEVVVPGFDHSYRKLVTACQVVALKTNRFLFEDDPRAAISPEDQRVPVVLVQ